MNKDNAKTDIWDRLGKTDPSHTKEFKRSGGFSGTAIKPMWAYRRMTEEFGPCGIGWGIGKPEFDIQDCGEVRLVYCTASVWYWQANAPEKAEVFGVGGDTVQGKNKYGATYDDEAFKKAYTDAITNALKMIGVGADVHMGMFDDSKYVNEAKSYFEAKGKPYPSAAHMKRKIAQIDADLLDAKSKAALTNLWKQWRVIMDNENWPHPESEDDETAYRNVVNDRFIARANQLEELDPLEPMETA